MKHGYLGGSFDPIHHGHLIAARDALEQLGLESVVFLPAANAPLKARAPQASAADRLAMIQLAIADSPGLRASDMEIRRGGTSYTHETVAALRERHPEAEPVWIIGEDHLATLPDWRRAEELVNQAAFACLRRPGSRPAVPTDRLPGLRLRLIDAHQVQISSTEIRARLRENRCCRYFLPDSVLNFINERKLYQTA